MRNWNCLASQRFQVHATSQRSSDLPNPAVPAGPMATQPIPCALQRQAGEAVGNRSCFNSVFELQAFRGLRLSGRMLLPQALLYFSCNQCHALSFMRREGKKAVCVGCIWLAVVSPATSPEQIQTFRACTAELSFERRSCAPGPSRRLTGRFGRVLDGGAGQDG